MRVHHISYSDIDGGAARASYRLHRALIAQGVESGIIVREKKTDDWTVSGPAGKLSRLANLLRPSVGSLALHLQNVKDGNLRSANWLPSGWSGSLNASAAVVVNLHWIGAETLSVEEVGCIRKPMVWTLHDMWPFCGAEHYASDGEGARWRTGYDKTNRSASASGIDLDRIVWRRKQRSWVRSKHIVAPSNWLADCARSSALFRNYPVTVIPNTLDTGIFQPLDQAFCRQTLGLPLDRRIILFGAVGGGNDPRKGYDLLLEALSRLAQMESMQNVLLVVFGQSEPEKPPIPHFPVRWMGRVHDDAALALLYGSADVMVVPSRQENLPQTATEAQACGCPVVAFDCTGLKDAVVHQETGFLARAFDTGDMAEGTRWILADPFRRQKLGHAARERALRLWAPEVVVPQYMSVYRSVMEQS